MAVAGVNHWRAFADDSPGLTDVAHDCPETGRAAAQALVPAMDGQRRSGIELPPGRLVIRASTSGFDGALACCSLTQSGAQDCGTVTLKVLAGRCTACHPHHQR
ncbi:substrate-binding domain-containing protein [Streptomyces sp. NPDC057249]|uniref:substrate-binding domain-containing protein n=1 Tax=Streptomyces sp. NPDC057249 TaxID=3346067 RepID=UPI003645A8FA